MENIDRRIEDKELSEYVSERSFCKQGLYNAVRNFFTFNGKKSGILVNAEIARFRRVFAIISRDPRRHNRANYKGRLCGTQGKTDYING